MLAVEEVLAAWRDAERLLEELPPLDPDHETVRLAVVSLRQTYQQITSSEAMRTQEVVAHSRETIDEARALLAMVRRKRLR